MPIVTKKRKFTVDDLNSEKDLNIVKKTGGPKTRRIKYTNDGALRKNTKKRSAGVGGNDRIKRFTSAGLQINENISNVQNQFSAINMPQPIFLITENINLGTPSFRKNNKKRSRQLEETYPDGP